MVSSNYLSIQRRPGLFDHVFFRSPAELTSFSNAPMTIAELVESLVVAGVPVKVWTPDPALKCEPIVGSYRCLTAPNGGEGLEWETCSCPRCSGENGNEH